MWIISSSLETCNIIFFFGCAVRPLFGLRGRKARTSIISKMFYNLESPTVTSATPRSSSIIMPTSTPSPIFLSTSAPSGYSLQPRSLLNSKSNTAFSLPSRLYAEVEEVIGGPELNQAEGEDSTILSVLKRGEWGFSELQFDIVDV